MEHKDIVVKTRDKYELLAMDTTRHCNARCKFCFNDWNKLKPTEMTEETFRKVLKLLPLLPDNGVYISCLYEPTIYEGFFKFLPLIPAGYEKKIFFTTNLVKKLTDEQLSVIAQANIDHINVSLETFDMDVYQDLVGVKNTHLYDNLTNLSAKLKDSNVKLRLITMMTQSNKDELVELVKRAHEEYAPFEHEIRTPFPPPIVFSDEKALGLYEAELLSREEVQVLEKGIRDLRYDNILLGTEWDKEKYYQSNRQTKNPNSVPSVKYDIRIEADGEVHFGGTDRYFSINDIDDVENYFVKQLDVLQEADTKNYLLDSSKYKINVVEEDGPCSLDIVELYNDHFLLLEGWDSFLANATEDRKPVMFVERTFHKDLHLLKSVVRPDVKEVFQRDDLLNSGFHTFIKIKNTNALKKSQFYVGYIEGDTVNVHKLPFTIG